MRPISVMNAKYCRAAAAGLLTICPSSNRAESRMSRPRTPTNGLADKVCCAACSRMSPSATRMSFAMGCSSRRTTFADQQAQELGDQGGLCLAFDLQHAVELEQHPPAALRLGGQEVCARAHARARLDRCDEADLVEPIVEPG